jgi:hypothetical protein
MIAQPEPVVSLSELARLTNISWPRALAMHQAGLLKPDVVSSHGFWFKKSRLAELQAIVERPFGISKAIRANQAAQAKKSPR